MITDEETSFVFLLCYEFLNVWRRNSRQLALSYKPEDPGQMLYRGVGFAWRLGALNADAGE